MSDVIVCRLVVVFIVSITTGSLTLSRHWSLIVLTGVWFEVLVILFVSCFCALWAVISRFSLPLYHLPDIIWHPWMFMHNFNPKYMDY